MEPSSLILVAIIGVWAAYLVPTWLRRRDDLVQSRTHDRFSTGLRVLTRRRRLARSGHRSGDAVLASPRVIVDADGELLFIAADRAKAAELAAERRAAEVSAHPAEGAAVPEPRITVIELASAAVEEKPIDPAAGPQPADTLVELASGAAKETPVEPAETPAQKIAIAAAKVERVARVQVSARVTPTKPDAAARSRSAKRPTPSSESSSALSTKGVPTSIATPAQAEPTTVVKASAAPAKAASKRAKSKAMDKAPARRPLGAPPAKAPAGFKVATSARGVTTERVASSGQRSSAPEPADAAALQHDLDAAAKASASAATRRAWIMVGLLVACVSAWAAAAVVSLWIGLPITFLLVLHTVASRAAALRSREHVTILSAQLQAAERSRSRPQRKPTLARRPAPKSAQPTAARVVREAPTGTDTWQPVPVPPPTYTLKPAAPRPEPAPLELPVAPKPAARKPAAAHKPAAGSKPASAVSRAALPRTPADIERILALDPADQDGYEHRTA